MTHLAKELARYESAWGINPHQLKNKLGKPFAWSFTALNQFETCPMQYAAERYFGLVKFKETEATLWGQRVHKALELRLKNGTSLPDDMQKWEKYCRSMESNAAKRKATLHPELQITVRRDFTLTDWFAKDAFGRCALDVVVDAGDTLYVWDWKTGKKGSDFQLEVCAAMASLRFPNVERYVLRYVQLGVEGPAAVSGIDLTVDQIPDIWARILHKIAVVETAWDEEQFICRPSGLCRGWCGHKSCTHFR